MARNVTVKIDLSAGGNLNAQLREVHRQLTTLSGSSVRKVQIEMNKFFKTTIDNYKAQTAAAKIAQSYLGSNKHLQVMREEMRLSTQLLNSRVILSRAARSLMGGPQHRGLVRARTLDEIERMRRESFAIDSTGKTRRSLATPLAQAALGLDVSKSKKERDDLDALMAQVGTPRHLNLAALREGNTTKGLQARAADLAATQGMRLGEVPARVRAEALISKDETRIRQEEYAATANERRLESYTKKSPGPSSKEMLESGMFKRGSPMYDQLLKTEVQIERGQKENTRFLSTIARDKNREMYGSVMGFFKSWQEERKSAPTRARGSFLPGPVASVLGGVASIGAVGAASPEAASTLLKSFEYLSAVIVSPFIPALMRAAEWIQRLATNLRQPTSALATVADTWMNTIPGWLGGEARPLNSLRPDQIAENNRVAALPPPPSDAMTPELRQRIASEITLAHGNRQEAYRRLLPIFSDPGNAEQLQTPIPAGGWTSIRQREQVLQATLSQRLGLRTITGGWGGGVPLPGVSASIGSSQRDALNLASAVGGGPSIRANPAVSVATILGNMAGGPLNAASMAVANPSNPSPTGNRQQDVQSLMLSMGDWQTQQVAIESLHDLVQSASVRAPSEQQIFELQRENFSRIVEKLGGIQAATEAMANIRPPGLPAGN